MRIVVSDDNIEEVVSHLLSIKSGVIALDTETFGLKWNDKMFALQLAVQDGNSFYFNFNPEQNPIPHRILADLKGLWGNDNIRWVMANAKFDMRRIDIEGVTLAGGIWDVLLTAKIQYNRYMSYSLDSCLKRINMAKNDIVSKWIKDNHAYTIHHVDGKKTKEKDLHYDRVPLDIMVSYGFDDVEQTLKLYEHQLEYFSRIENKEQMNLVHDNIDLVKTVFAMEKAGVQLDIDYCKRMNETELCLAAEKYDRIEQMTSMKFKAGPKWLMEVLNAQQVKVEVSDKGNPILDKNALKAMPNAIAHYVLEIRDHEKRASTFGTMQRFADQTGVLHTNYRLNGTDTLRFSSNDPNLQNIEACPKDNYSTPRTAFTPREDSFFVSIDYRTMEYRLCADLAGEHKWIQAINDGADPHQWVADMMKVDRKSAKTLNFMLLYGGGTAKLALALYPCKTNEEILKAICMVYVYKSKHTTPSQRILVEGIDSDTLKHEIEQLEKAQEVKNLYFETLPAVSELTKKIQEVAIGRGYVKNQYGMRYHLDNPRFAYSIPNHLIQGTGACIIRSAMNKLNYALDMMKSRMLLQIHDELLFEIDNNESSLVPELQRIMEVEYKPVNGMYLKCDVEYSMSNWNANNFKKWEEYGK